MVSVGEEGVLIVRLIFSLNRVQHSRDWSATRISGGELESVPDLTHKPGITHFREGCRCLNREENIERRTIRIGCGIAKGRHDERMAC